MSTTPVHQTPPDDYASPSITIILTVILLVFFFFGFFSIYFCRCFMENLPLSWLGRTPSAVTGAAGSSTSRGLDPSIIDSFPTFVYSVKEFQEHKYGLECAICLCEFKEEDMLRLLTVCYHVFHHDCIDLWLGSQTTCPVCRRSLDGPIKSQEKSPLNNATTHDIDENEALDDACRIRIKDEDEDRKEVGSSTGGGGTSTVHDLGIVDNDKVGKFSRSHSTGHSTAWTKVEEDKHILKLPEHVKAKIVRGHNWSCTTFGDYSSSKIRVEGSNIGEVSSSNEENV